MNAHIEEILEKSLAVKLGILAGVAGLIFGIFYFAIYQGVETELAKKVKEIDGKNGLNFQISQEKVIASNLPSFQKEVERLDLQLNAALSELPDTKEVGQLLEKVSDKAQDSGLEIKVFRTRSIEKKDFFAEVPVEIEVGGTFHQAATFFDEVSRLERIVNLSNVSMTEPVINDESVQLNISMIATAFRFLSEAERPKPREEKRKGRRRRKR